jgi:hypothetical protein
MDLQQWLLYKMPPSFALRVCVGKMWKKNYVKNLIRRREVLKATSACRECACSARVSAEPNKTRNKKTERDKEEEE